MSTTDTAETVQDVHDFWDGLLLELDRVGYHEARERLAHIMPVQEHRLDRKRRYER